MKKIQTNLHKNGSVDVAIPLNDRTMLYLLISDVFGKPQLIECLRKEQ